MAAGEGQAHRGVVAITGCNRGIGRSVAEAFAKAGWGVIVHAREGRVALEVAHRLGAVASFHGDLDDAELPGRLAVAIEAAGGLDMLVLNAAVLGPKGPLGTLDRAIFSEVMRLNVDCQFSLFRAALEALVERRGTVVWMSSGLGRFVLPNYGAYCVSKHAVEALSKLAHAEYGERGLISVTVAPGMVATEMLKAAIEVDDVSQYASPEAHAERFLRLVTGLRSEDSGKALDSSGE